MVSVAFGGDGAVCVCVEGCLCVDECLCVEECQCCVCVFVHVDVCVERKGGGAGSGDVWCVVLYVLRDVCAMKTSRVYVQNQNIRMFETRRRLRRHIQKRSERAHGDAGQHDTTLTTKHHHSTTQPSRRGPVARRDDQRTSQTKTPTSPQSTQPNTSRSHKERTGETEQTTRGRERETERKIRY